MRTFNTIASIVLLIAVSYLFYNSHSSYNGVASSGEDLLENLDQQESQGVRVAYIDTDSLVKKYEYHQELRSELEVKAKALEADLAEKSRVFQENVQMLEQQAGSMSQQQLQEAQLDLQGAQQRLINYRDEKAAQLAEEEQELNILIKDDMDDILVEIREEFNIDFILSFDPSSILLQANEQYNITDLVVERLNKKYKESAGVSEEE